VSTWALFFLISDCEVTGPEGACLSSGVFQTEGQSPLQRALYAGIPRSGRTGICTEGQQVVTSQGQLARTLLWLLALLEALDPEGTTPGLFSKLSWAGASGMAGTGWWEWGPRPRWSLARQPHRVSPSSVCDQASSCYQSP
jgi:hypothetical protein